MSDARAIAIVSGGLDSVTLAYFLHREGYQLHGDHGGPQP
jgi:7-cyano-7-deazaguanine synthase